MMRRGWIKMFGTSAVWWYWPVILLWEWPLNWLAYKRLERRFGK